MDVYLVMVDLFSRGHFLAQAAPVKDSGTGWVIAGLGAVVLMYLYMRGRAKKRADPLADPSRMSTAQQKHLDRQMQSLVVELSEMAREMSAQIDTRSQKLTALMEDADKKIAVLQRLKAELSAVQAVDAGRGLNGELDGMANDTPGEAFGQPGGRTQQQMMRNTQVGARMSLVSDDEPAADTTRETGRHAAQVHVHHEMLLQHAEIYQLADLGESISDISRRLGKPSGEIELILSLRKSPRRTAL
jgi:hypothetical protein